MKLTSRTGLGRIRLQVFEDFGVVIDNATAHEIHDAALQGRVTWTSRMLRIVGTDYNLEISTSGVKENAAAYSVSEWNATRN